MENNIQNNQPNPDQKDGQKSLAAKAAKAALWAKLMDFGLEFAVIIALPLLGFIYLGKWLDAKYHSKLFIVGGILLAIALSNYIIYKRLKGIKDMLK